MACAQCGADTGHFYDCPESRFARLETSAPTAAPPREVNSEKARLVAVPIALAVMLLLVHTSLGAFITRLCFAMPLHELGHATASWFTGAPAVPLLWFTPMSDTRSVFFIVLELAAFGGWAAYARRNALPRWPVILVATLFGVGLVLPSAARLAFVTFAGDGGALVFGTMLMAAVWLPDELRITRGGLRWGYLVIGAGAYANIASEWFGAWRDSANIAFGRIEGVGLSDPSKLVDVYNWSERRLVNSYLTLSFVCLVVLVVLGLRFARQRD
jgi:hypothetical protein